MDFGNSEKKLREVKARPDVKRLQLFKWLFFSLAFISYIVFLILNNTVFKDNKSLNSTTEAVLVSILWLLFIGFIVLGCVFGKKRKKLIELILHMQLIEATNAALEASKNTTGESEGLENAEDLPTSDTVASEASGEKKSEEMKTPEECRALADKMVSVYVKGYVFACLSFFFLIISAVMLLFIPICSVLGLQDVSLFDLIKGFAKGDKLSLGYLFANDELFNKIVLIAFFVTCGIVASFIVALPIMAILLIINIKRIRNAIETPEKYMRVANYAFGTKYDELRPSITFAVAGVIMFITFAVALLCLPIKFIIWTEGLATINYATLIFAIIFILASIGILIYSSYYNAKSENNELLLKASEIVASKLIRRNFKP